MLPNFSGTPELALSPDGAYLVAREGGAGVGQTDGSSTGGTGTPGGIGQPGGGGPASAVAPSVQGGRVTGTVHFSATYLVDTNYRYDAFVYVELKGPDFYLTLNPDGTAQVIQTVTTPYGAGAYPANREYRGTYT